MEQQQAVSARIEQLQAADLPAALQGLLQQAHSQLRPPSRSNAGSVAAPAAARRALVSGVLLLLERAVLLAAQHSDLKMLKDVHNQLLTVFQQHGWLWELLLRKHLPDLLQHPGAAQLFAKAVGRLPTAAQVRSLRLWRQQLAAQPQLRDSVPLGLAQVWLEQLSECFQARTISLPLLPRQLSTAADAGGEGSTAAAAAAGVDVSALVDQHAGLAVAGASEVHVALREQLPHLLQLLLCVTCSGGSAGLPAGGAVNGQGPIDVRPSLSSMQSAATEVRANPPDRQAQQAQQAPGTASGGTSDGSVGQAACSGAPPEELRAVQKRVLRHAVVLISQLSDPEGLHSMLRLHTSKRARDHGGDGDVEDEDTAEAGAGWCSGGLAAAAARHRTQSRVLSRRDWDRVQAAQALIEVCLDGMLALPLLAAEVHCQLHSKGSSTGGGASGAGSGDGRRAASNSAAGAGMPAVASRAGILAGAVAEAVGRGEDAEQAMAAEAELRHTAGVMLGLHRELSRFRQAQEAGGALLGAQQPAAELFMSLHGCQRLLSMLVCADSAAAGGGGSEPGSAGRWRSEVTAQKQHSQGPLAVLLMPPQLVAHGLELIRHTVEGCSRSSGASHGSTSSGSCAEWCGAMAEQAAAMYASCYQALWGAKVLQSAEAYQLLLSAAHLRMLLRGAVLSGGAAGSEADGSAEAAAEAAMLTHNVVGGRQRRQRGNIHDLSAASRLGAAAATPAAAGSGALAVARQTKAGTPAGAASNAAVAELLQLFQPAPAVKGEGLGQAGRTPSAPQQQEQQQQRAGRKRIQAVPLARQGDQQPQQQQQHHQQQQQQHHHQQQQQQPGRKRITPQQIQPAPDASQQKEQQPQQERQREQQQEQGDEGPHASAEHALPGQQRVVISKAGTMTDEEQEALWEAYIADKEFLVEMLGDSEYQQWYDEAAHPLRQQQRRPGGLEAAWAAVLGGASTRSMVQLALPRTLLEASASMPWDAAAAACLGLLRTLLSTAEGGCLRGRVGARAVAGPCEGDALRELLQRLFPLPVREAGARAATRICHLQGRGEIELAARAARAAPVCGAAVLLAAHMLALAEGHSYFDQFASWAARQRQDARGQQSQGEGGGQGGRLLAPPLLAAYSQLLAALLPAARAEAEAVEAAGDRPAAQPTWLLSLLSLMAHKLLLLPPPLHHALGPDCTPLLQLALPPDCDRPAAVEQHAALMWALAQQCLAGSGGAAEVQAPADGPAWLDWELAGLLPSGDGSKGHALLLGPPPETLQAAAAELLAWLRQLMQQESTLQQQQEQEEQQQQLDTSGSNMAPAGEGLVAAEVLLPAADACHAAIQLLLAEHQRRQQEEQQADDGLQAAASEEEDDGDASGGLHSLPPLLLGHAAAVADLAAALCHAGAVAGAELAVQLDAAALQARQQRKRGKQDWGTASSAAATLALCNQLLEPADRLLLAGCLPVAAQQQLDAACGKLEGQLQSVDQLSRQLPARHGLLAAMGQAMEAAPALWQPAGDGGSGADGGEGSSDEEQRAPGGQRSVKRKRAKDAGSGQGKHGDGASAGGKRPRRRKRLRDVRNPAVRAMLTEDGGGGELDASDLSDLEDFIVFNPERDYEAYFRQHFYHLRESDSEEEEDKVAAKAAGGGSNARRERCAEAPQRKHAGAGSKLDGTNPE